jgi:hypothetical protein
MNNENFSTLELLHKQFRYPFPTLKNPNAEQLQDITENQWIDGEYLWLYEKNPDLRKKYKKTKTAHIAAQWFPTASPERFRPICRLMLWTLYNDDLYEESEPEAIGHVHAQSIAILNGEIIAEESGIPLGAYAGFIEARITAVYSTGINLSLHTNDQQIFYRIRN